MTRTHSSTAPEHFGTGRKRSDDFQLPRGPERTTAKGHTYYYWNPGRKTDREGEWLRLPNPKSDPVGFWREIERRQRTKTAFATGSVGELVDLYRSNEAFRDSPTLQKRAITYTSIGSAGRTDGVFCGPKI
jgi:hypothetical protein